jgi:hypothetical protein
MSLLRRLTDGLRALFRKEQVSQELDEELNTFLEMATQEKMKQGMSRKDALRAVRLERGSPEITKEVVRSAGWESLVETCWQDLRFAPRILRKSPVFTAVAVLTLTLGIGATTAIFSLVEAVLLRPLPYPDPQRLVSVFEDLGSLGYPRLRVTPATYADLRAQTQLFEDVAAVNESGFNLSSNTGEARQLNAALVTYNLFAVLGTKPLMGTSFLPDDDRPGANHVVLLSFVLWQRDFAGNPGVIGQARASKSLVFPSPHLPDQPISTVKTAWKATLRRAGVPHFPIYNLRHVFCTRLSGVAADAVVQRAMRHTSPETKRRYQLGMTDQVRQAVEKSNEKAYGRNKVLRFYDVRPDAKNEGAKAVCN